MSKRLTTEEFIKKAKLVHGSKYDYSLVEYVNNRTKVKIICKDHGAFEQKANNHIDSLHGCPECGLLKNNKLTTKEFIEKAKLVHGDRYDYSLTNYRNAKTKVKIICKDHGFFEQRADCHLSNRGCPICNNSKGEIKVRKYLIDNGIEFIQQKRFDKCKDINSLPFDFYLPESNTIIEFDGIQHFVPVEHWGGAEYLKDVNRHDEIKNTFCLHNKIKLIRVKYNQDIIKRLDESLNV